MVNELLQNKKDIKFLMDDEAYFTMDYLHWENKYYYENNNLKNAEKTNNIINLNRKRNYWFRLQSVKMEFLCQYFRYQI